MTTAALRIVHLSIVHRPDDPRIFERECRTLADAGHAVTYVVPAPVPGGSPHGVDFWALPQRPRSRRLLNTTEILRAVRTLKPHVVHFHDPEILAILPVLRRLVPRLVYDVHEYHHLELAQKYYLPERVRPHAPKAAAAAQRTALRLVDGLVAVVDDQFDDLGPRPALRVTLPNYPRFTRFAEPEARVGRRADPRLRLVHIGSLTKSRGVPTMLDVLARHQAEGHNDALLCLGGVFYNPKFEAEVRERIDGELAGRVELLGRVAPDDVPGYLAAADVVWIASTLGGQHHRRMVPTKLYEGLAAGCAALVSDLPGRADVVLAEDCGVAVPPTVEGHAAGLAKLLADRDAVAQMGARGRHAVEQRYCWEVIEDRLLDFYDELTRSCTAPVTR